MRLNHDIPNSIREAINYVGWRKGSMLNPHSPSGFNPLGKLDDFLKRAVTDCMDR